MSEPATELYGVENPTQEEIDAAIVRQMIHIEDLREEQKEAKKRLERMVSNRRQIELWSEPGA